jgi:DNA repair exonuclease SbcCD ATPase subunit
MTTKKIAKVRISNILGIDELEFTPDGKLTEITGKNGKGKTSVLEAIKSVAGGSDATLLRKGAEKGEVVLVLDDGTELINKVTASSSTKTMIRDGKKVPKPADAIRQLVDLLSVNPVEFLTARKQDRVKVLLEAMPIELDVEKLSRIAGVPVKAAPGVPALDLIELVRKQVYEDRTGTNRAVKEKDSTINQMTLALPEVPEGVSGNEDELRAQLEQARTTRDAEHQRIATKLDGIRKENSDKVATLRAEAQAQIDAINAKLQQDVDAAKAELTDWEGKAARQRELTTERFTTAASPLNEALAVIKSSRDTFAKREQAEAYIKQMQEELAGLQQDADRQTKALDAIDAYKVELISKLPIPGLEVVNGEVLRNGIVFDRLNTAQQVDIAIEIAKLRAGELAIACVDNFEMLDPEAFEEFRARAEESNLQLFVTRVTGDEFQIQ